MKQMLALFWARTKEYYRDKGSLAWSFIMPPMIIAVIAFAFSGGERELFKVGVAGNATLPEALAQPWVQRVPVTNLERALVRVQHHQLDMLISPAKRGNLRYWINSSSQRGSVLERLLHGESAPGMEKQTVSGREVRYIDWVIPGVLGMNIMFSGLFGVGYVIVRYRKNGVLKRLQATPVTPLQFLSAQMLSRLLIMLVVSTLVYITCDLFLDFLMLGSYLNLLLVALVGNVAILSMGLIVASRLASEELANGLLNFLSFPMLLLSEVWFSLDGAPAWMSTVSDWLPLTHMVKAARRIMIDGATLVEIGPHLLALLAMSAVFLVIAARLFKWREG